MPHQAGAMRAKGGSLMSVLTWHPRYRPSFVRSLLLVAVSLLFVPASLLGDPGFAADGSSRFARFEGSRVRYLSYGSGHKGLVFVHGWSCNATFWDAQIPAFMGKTRVLAVDLPGHGESDKPERAYTMEYFARAVESVMRDAGVDSGVLVGHSMGTPVVRQFYRLFPKKVEAIVIVDGALRPYVPGGDARALFAPLRGPGYRDFVASFINMMVPSAAPALRERVRQEMLKTPQHVMVSAMDGMLAKDIWGEDRIGKPVLAIMAKGSWPADNEAFFRRIAPNLDYQEWEGVGHFLMMQEPAEFNAAVQAFLVKRHLLGYE